ncbi:hypothetical protein [Chitinophaga sp. S165]|uniref:hypothetical protein n=1 Tax=Chitinophaga sp. S165 TaxID=2135462 RepID=UPI000D70CC4A|nr:hypothetical protein [Chitinophaga sp. S165]PWV56338.1 hypothetical protein C7475_101853 [Chitinophaga sp. S165]
MANTTKRNASDWTVIVLGLIGLILGIIGLCHPQSQYEMMGLKQDALKAGSVIPGLMGSGSLSAVYVGIMYIFGVLKKWPHFKSYLVFARMVMCAGFLLLVAAGRAPHQFIPAALWEGGGALLILMVLWLDNRFAGPRSIS